MKYRRVKSVEPSAIKLVGGEPLVLQFLEEPYPSSSFIAREGEEDRKPPIVAKIRAFFSDGEFEERTLVLGTVLQQKLIRSYPEGIKGLCFEITKSAEKKGTGQNQYYTYDVYQIEMESVSEESEDLPF